MPRLKVMTLNLWGYRGDWPARRARLVQCMQDEEIDVVLLQEVAEKALHPNQAWELSQLTGYAMLFTPAQRFFPWPSVSTGLAVLSRFPISNPLITEILPSSSLIPSGAGERRIAQRVELSLDGMSVVLYNTHFPADTVVRSTVAQRLWSQVIQEESVLIVVGGDFNAHPQEEAITFLLGGVPLHGMRGTLVDAWVTAGIGPPNTYPAERPDARIDYILYQAEPSVVLQECRVIGQADAAMSDHAAVVATFAISPSHEHITPLEEEPVATLEPTGGGRLGGGLE
jgi:endonuclease/exonuclease/phosphatase family metal-dependent hydrolase